MQKKTKKNEKNMYKNTKTGITMRRMKKRTMKRHRQKTQKKRLMYKRKRTAERSENEQKEINL